MKKYTHWPTNSNYRESEIKQATDWITLGKSFSVIGLPGCGRTNFLDFLCTFYSDMPSRDCAANLIFVDINALPSMDIDALYLSILDEMMMQTDHQASREYDVPNPAAAERMLRLLIAEFGKNRQKNFLILDHFDSFCEVACQADFNRLRALRDRFKDILYFVVGMPQPITSLSEPEKFTKMYELLRDNICWIGAMSDDDAELMIQQELASNELMLNSSEIKEVLALTGNFPSLLKVVAEWWSENHRLPLELWLDSLYQTDIIRYRLNLLWEGLTRQEQAILARLQKYGRYIRDDSREKNLALESCVKQLKIKGVCQAIAENQSTAQVSVRGKLLTKYAEDVGMWVLTTIHWDPQDDSFYRDIIKLDLTPKQKKMLSVFSENPDQWLKSQFIADKVWPDMKDPTDNLRNLIMRLRRVLKTGGFEDVDYIEFENGRYKFHSAGIPKK